MRAGPPNSYVTTLRCFVGVCQPQVWVQSPRVLGLSPLLLHTLHQLIRHVACCRGLPLYKMELSESVQRGLQSLADPSAFDRTSFQVLVDVSFRSLLSSQGDPGVLDQPELKQVDQILVKQSHTAAATFILEAVKQSADKSTISSCLEELTFSAERIEIFYSTFQKHKTELERLLGSIGRCPPRVNDVSWRLQYHTKNGHVDKVNEPFYVLTLNTQNEGSSEDINFTCTVEQLQDLVGKLKDAAKSVEKASQM